MDDLYDDLKIYAKNEAQLDEMLAITKEFSADIHVQFRLEKCARASVRKVKLVRSQVVPSVNSAIKNLEPENSYKYFGIEESSQSTISP